MSSASTSNPTPRPATSRAAQVERDEALVRLSDLYERLRAIEISTQTASGIPYQRLYTWAYTRLRAQLMRPEGPVVFIVVHWLEVLAFVVLSEGDVVRSDNPVRRALWDLACGCYDEFIMAVFKVLRRM